MKRLLIMIIVLAECAAGAIATPVSIPAGTHLQVTLTAPIASNVAKMGESFAFVAAADLIVNGVVIVRKGAPGYGTVVFAGAAGSHGHEGNLHLRFDTLSSTLGNVVLGNTEFEVNGKKQKVLGRLSGVSILTGFGQAVRGGQAAISTSDVLDLVVPAPACILASNAAPCPPFVLPSNAHE